MPTRTEPLNAIAYAQFHLRGGVKNLLLTMVGTLLLAGVLAVPMFASMPNRTQQAAQGSLYMLLVVQWLVLGFFGGSRVTAAVRQDLSSGLIESHRLTPTPPLAAVLGYVLGAPVQALAIAAVIFPCGIALAVTANVPVWFWLIGNVMALGACAVLWTLAAVLTFSTRQAGAVPVMAVIVASLSAALVIVPGIAVLASPIAGQSLWDPSRIRGALLPTPYTFTLVADGLLAGVFLLAAARRYRSVATDAFSPTLGVLLLLIWSALNAIGMAQPDLFWDARQFGRIPEEQVRLVAGLCSATMVALLPTAAIARAAVMPPEMMEAGRPRVWAPLMWLAMPLVAALVWSPAAVEFTNEWTSLAGRQWGTAAVVTATLLGVAFWIAAADLRGRTGWASALIWVVFVNVTPLLVAAVIQANNPYPRPRPPRLFAVSPAASLAMLWDTDPKEALPGVAVQIGLLVVPLAYLLYRLSRRTKQTI